MVSVELIAYGLCIYVFLRHLMPREFKAGVYIALDDSGLVAAEGQAFEARALFQEDFFGFFGELAFFDAFAEFVYVRELAVLAELLPDDVHLLAQEVVALGTVDAFLGLVHDLALGCEDEYLVLEGVDEYLEPVADADRFEDYLLDLDVQHDVRRDIIGEVGRIAGQAYLEQDIRGQLGRELHISLKDRLERPHESQLARSGDAGAGTRLDRSHSGVQAKVVIDRADDSRPVQTLDHDSGGLFALFEYLSHTADNAYLVHIVDRRIVEPRVDLSCEKNELIRRHGAVESRLGALSADLEVQHHLREDHDSAQWQNGDIESVFCIYRHSFHQYCV